MAGAVTDQGSDEKLGIAVEIAKRAVDAQIANADYQDGRMSGALTAGTAILPLTIGLVGIVSDDPAWFETALLVGAIVAYGVLVVSSLALLRYTTMSYRPNPISALENVRKFPEHPIRILQVWAANEYCEATRENAPRLAKRRALVIAALVAYHMEAALLAIAALFAMF